MHGVVSDVKYMGAAPSGSSSIEMIDRVERI